jgi:hypothetical protein
MLATIPRLGYTPVLPGREIPMRWICLLLLLGLSTGAQAYIGPGAGLNVLGSLWAVLVGIVLALFAILTWPLRLLWRKLRGPRDSQRGPDADEPDADESRRD